MSVVKNFKRPWGREKTKKDKSVFQIDDKCRLKKSSIAGQKYYTRHYYTQRNKSAMPTKYISGNNKSM